MRYLKTLAVGLFFAFISMAIMGALLMAQNKTTYSVYCANNRIEVDMRTLEQMKNARGSDICRLGKFNYLSDAQSFAQKNFGGVGAACSCK